jgi:hypothetical protein
MRRPFLSAKSHVVLAFLVAFLATIGFAYADADSIFKQLAGSWRSTGTLTFTDGTRQRLSCRGYYVLKSGGDGLSIAILCNAPDQKVEIRSQITQTARGISGRWEERTFNAMGEVSGRASGNKINLSIKGAITGSISISVSGRRHSVEISTEGTGFSRVSISLMRG